MAQCVGEVFVPCNSPVAKWCVLPFRSASEPARSSRECQGLGLRVAGQRTVMPNCKPHPSEEVVSFLGTLQRLRFAFVHTLLGLL